MPYLRDLYRVRKKIQKNPTEKPLKTQKKSFFWIWATVLLLACINIFYITPSILNYVVKIYQPIPLLKDGRYLVLFQNNSELRSSGGFIGTFATVEIKNFEIKNINFNTNIYKLDNAFALSNYVEAPVRLKNFLKGKSWTLRDSNYDVSFTEAVEDINSFYEKESGDKVDGIVAVNAQVMVDLLKNIGPVKIDEEEINADNFYEVTQFAVEKGYYQNQENWLENEPKTFLKKLYPEVIARALQQGRWHFSKLVLEEIQEKQIIFYFKNPTLQQLILEKNWGGQIADFEGDYLNITANNFSGNKSSLSVKQRVIYDVSDDLANLEITRSHRGTNVWPDGTNVSYLRILVPKGSVLVNIFINGRDIQNKTGVGEEAGKTVFAFDVGISPGELAVIKLQYRLPFSNSREILVQKQPGTVDDFYEIKRNGSAYFTGILNADITFKN